MVVISIVFIVVLIGLDRDNTEELTVENQGEIGSEKELKVQTDFENPLEKDFIIIAHRGASGYAPEHTMEAYKLAVEMEADYVELDLHETKDGALVAMHDETVDRTTNGHGKVSDLTLKEIKELDAGMWFNNSFEGLTVPTLEEIFIEFGNSVNYYIEIKSYGMEEELVSLLEAYDLLNDNQEGKIVIQSFMESSLKNVKELNGDIPLIQLSRNEALTDGDLQGITDYAIGIGINYKLLDESLVQKIKNHDLMLHPYTVDKSKDIETLKSMGVDGVFTNYIDAYVQ